MADASRDKHRFSGIDTLSELMALLEHELNQPLTAILGNAQAALRSMERGSLDQEELREIFNDIIEDGRRAVEMFRDMRSKLKTNAAEHEPLLLNDLVWGAMQIVHKDDLAGNNSVDLDLDPSIPSIEGNRRQLQPVVLNLIANAFEAMNAAGRPGKLVLRTRQAGEDVLLDVIDSGPGIPRDNPDRIFDPFFTTKADALGMGLSLSRSIVTKHGGRIWADNIVDGGAAFHVSLPVKKSLGMSRPANGDRSSNGNEKRVLKGLTILIADDQKSFRHAVASILSDLPGLKLVVEAADGQEAVGKAGELKPDLIVLDVSLPVISGVEAAARILGATPDARILFLTQHESPDFVRAAMGAGARGYVLKVDVGHELLHAARVVLRGEQYLSPRFCR